MRRRAGCSRLQNDGGVSCGGCGGRAAPADVVGHARRVCVPARFVSVCRRGRLRPCCRVTSSVFRRPDSPGLDETARLPGPRHPARTDVSSDRPGRGRRMQYMAEVAPSGLVWPDRDVRYFKCRSHVQRPPPCCRRAVDGACCLIRTDNTPPGRQHAIILLPGLYGTHSVPGVGLGTAVGPVQSGLLVSGDCVGS